MISVIVICKFALNWFQNHGNTKNKCKYNVNYLNVPIILFVTIPMTDYFFMLLDIINFIQKYLSPFLLY